jgi:uncharacterized repeat protein (TIGR01451 family)
MNGLMRKGMVLIGFVCVVMALVGSGRSSQAAAASQVQPEPDPFSDRYPAEITINAGAEGQYLARLNIDVAKVRSVGLTQRYPQIVTVYVNAGEVEQLLQVGLAAVAIPNESLAAFRKYGPGSNQPGDWPTYDAWVVRMQGLANNYPSLVRIVTIGRSVQNRSIYCLQLTSSPDIPADKPEFRYTSTMHGNEPVGAEMTMRLAEYLTSGYGIDPVATNLVNNIETWLCQFHNPDGYMNGSRYNANGYDLNRDFPDPLTDPIDSPLGRQVETQAFMNQGYTRHFVMGANYHTGALVVNYPWDCCDGQYTQEDALFQTFSLGYSSRNLPMYNSPYFYHGIVRGWEWYVVNGGMQDWAYNWRGEHAVTIEVSDYQPPPYIEMVNYWNDNREAMLWWMGRTLTGARGIITDAVTGDPLEASVVASGINKPVTTDPAVGDYHRMLLAGTYTLQASAFCHQSAAAPVTIPSADAIVVQDFALQPSPNFNMHGIVTDQVNGQPLRATIEVVGTPIKATAGGNGQYSLDICQGSYTLRVSAPFHRPFERQVTLSGDQEQNFSLEYAPSTLLVDDDLGAPYQTYYQTALTAAGVSFDTWPVADKGGPSTASLEGYGRVVWLTGDDYLTTLTQDEQNALADYLDVGGRLFLSGQNIAYNIGSTSFFQSYLHASYIGDNSSVRSLVGEDFLLGLSLSISGVGGANNQKYPADIEPVNGAISVLNYGAPYHHGGAAYQNSNYRVVFFSFGFEAINDATKRKDVMQRTLNWLGGIKADLAISKTDGRETVTPGDSVTYTIVVRNQGPMVVTGAVVTDTFPGILENVSWTCLASVGSACSLGTGSGNIASTVNLAVDGTATFTATGTLSPSASGTLSNTATVSPPIGGEDPNPENNAAMDTDAIIVNTYFIHLPMIARTP